MESLIYKLGLWSLKDVGMYQGGRVYQITLLSCIMGSVGCSGSGGTKGSFNVLPTWTLFPASLHPERVALHQVPVLWRWTHTVPLGQLHQNSQGQTRRGNTNHFDIRSRSRDLITVQLHIVNFTGVCVCVFSMGLPCIRTTRMQWREPPVCKLSAVTHTTVSLLMRTGPVYRKRSGPKLWLLSELLVEKWK